MADIPISYYKAVVRSQKFNPVNPPSLEEPPPVLNPPGSGTTDAFVPYEGASRDVDLGANSLLAESITLNPAPATIPTAQGSLYFDADEETIAAILNGTTQKIGEDSFIQVKNQSGVTIPKGTAVRFDGVLGASGRVIVVPFLADGTYPSMYFVGVTSEEILNGGDGKAYNGGKVRGINTNAYTVGTILYCSTSVAGGFQSTAPIAPNNIISVAAVIAQSATVGALLVRPQIGSNINYDEGVKIVSVQNGDILKYNDSTGLFENTPETGSTKDGLISGGLVQWTGTGFVFNVSRALARFSQIELDSLASSQVTLAASHATLNRRDVFILQVGFDGAGTPISITPDKITGTAAASPVKPQINPLTQIELTDILVIAASTTPTLTTEVIYDQNIEWTGSSSGTGTAVFNSAVNPYVGTVSVETTNIQNGFYIQFNNGSEIDRNDYQTLGFFLDLKNSMPANQNLYITFLNGSLAPVSGFTLLNFDKSSTIYQFVGIALSSISFTSDMFQYIRFSFVRTGGSPTYSGYFLDIVKFEGGINPPVQFGTFLSLGDTPNSYSGQGGKTVAVKADESGLEFVTGGGGGGGTFIGLSDTPANYTGSANKFPRVNSVPDALIFDTVSPHDLDQEGATNGQVLTWVSANSRYEPVTVSGASNWTVVGSDIYRNSAVSIGRTTIPTNATFAVQSLTTTGAARFFQILNNSGTEIFSIQQDSSVICPANLRVGGAAGIGGRGPHIKGTVSTAGNTIFRVENSSSSIHFDINGDGETFIYKAGLRVGGASSLANRGPNFRGTVSTGIAIFRIENSSGFNVFDVNGDGSIQFSNGGNFILGTTTGNKIGTATTQKLAFWNKTPIIQPTTAITGATRVAGGGTTITDTDTFGGYTVAQLAAILINTGLTA